MEVSSTQALDEALERIRYAHYYADYHSGLSQEQINRQIDEHVKKQRLVILEWLTENSPLACVPSALDRLSAKLQTYRARSLNSSQASLLDALADDIAEERKKVRGGGRE